MILTRISRQLWLCSFLLLSLSFYAQEEKLTILFTGDVMQHGPQITGAFNKTSGTYEYDEGFKFIKPIVESKDIAVANLEITHAGKPYKGYPQFSAPDELSYSLKNTGFDILVTANNHSCDGGSKGVIRTLDILDKVGIRHTGTFRNAKEREENYPLMIEEKGIKIALLNYTYGTNGLTVAAPLIINYIDSAQIQKDVAKAKSMQADYIICAIHWGAEYKSLPNNYQKNYEAFCYELGVDMIMGGHPHVLQPIEKKIVEGKERVTAWSMGNFVSNQRDRYKNGGIFINSTLNINKGKVQSADVNYNLFYVHAKQVNGLKPYYLLPDFNYSAYKGFLSEADSTAMALYFSDSRKLFKEHNKGVNEEIISISSKTGKLINNHVNGYYTVMIDPQNQNLKTNLLEADYKIFVSRKIKSDGTYGLFSGVYETKEKAIGQKQFLKDCQLENKMNVVFISPDNQIRIVE